MILAAFATGTMPEMASAKANAVVARTADQYPFIVLLLPVRSEVVPLNPDFMVSSSLPFLLVSTADKKLNTRASVS